MIELELESLIAQIDEKSDFEDELFFQILETTDVLEKAQIIEKVRRKCKEVGRLDEFNNLLVAWEKKVKELDSVVNNIEIGKIRITAPKKEDIESCWIKDEKGKIKIVDELMLQTIKKEYSIFIMAGIPYIYSNGVYIADNTGAILKTIIRLFIPITQVKSTLVNSIYNLFFQDCELLASEEDVNKYPLTWIPFKDYLYDVLTGKVHNYTPVYRVINQIPYNCMDIISSTEKGRIDTFIEQAILPEDRQTILEYIGYCLSRNNSLQKMVLLKGGRGTGKSVLLSLIEKAVGKENVSNVPLQSIEEKFHSIQLLHKLVNICADLSALPLKTTNAIKLITGGDYLTDSYKGKDLITFKVYCKCIFSTNTIPLILDNDVSNAFYKRLCIVEMNNPPDKPDRELLNTLESEIPHLINLALKAYKEALERGFLFESENSKRLVKELYADSDSAQDFLDKCTIRQIGASVLKSDLYRRYWTFCAEEDRQPLTKQSFNRRLRSKGLREYRSNGERWKEIQLIN